MFNKLKEQVFNANLELVRRGLVLYTWGNVSGIDREAGIVAIKPSGVPYETMCAEDIVLVNLTSGRVLAGNMKPSSDTPTHLALYRAFPEAGGIVHTHSRFATIMAQAERPIPALGTTHADYFYGEIPVTRHLTHEEISCAYELETGNVIAEAFSGRDPMNCPAALVAGHGPFAWGKDADEAVYHAVVLEEVANMAWHTLQWNPKARLDQALMDKHFQRKHGKNAYYGQ